MGPAAVLLVGVALAASNGIEHEQLGDSTNATRHFCVRIESASENSLLQPVVHLTYHNDSRLLPLLQSEADPHIFRGDATFQGTGRVDYIITAGSGFWGPKDGSVASFWQLGAQQGAKATANRADGESAVPHQYYYNDIGSGFFVFLVLYVLIFLCLASAVVV